MLEGPGLLELLLPGKACPKFGHPALSAEFYNYALNSDFVAALDMLSYYPSVFSNKTKQWNQWEYLPVGMMLSSQAARNP